MIAAAFVLLAGAAAAAEPATILILDPEGDDADVSTSFAAAVANRVAADRRAKVYTSDDVKKLASLAAAQQATGCDSSTCLAEIGDALGARYVVFGAIVRLGDERQVDLRLFDVKTASILAREQGSARSRPATIALAPALTKRLLVDLLPPPGLFERPLFVAGSSVCAASAVTAGATGAFALALNATAADPASLGADKALARGVGPWLVVVAAVTGVAAVAGGTAAVAGVFIE